MAELNKNKKVFTKSSEQLNKQILDYYYNFGRDRDLEKYLRLNTRGNKSSSEGSLSGLSKYSHDNNFKSEDKRQAKSLEHMNEHLVLTNKNIDDDKDFENCVLEKESLRLESEKENLNQQEDSNLIHFSSTDLDENCDSVQKSIIQTSNVESNTSPKNKDIDIKPIKKQNEVKVNLNLIQKPKLLEWDSLGDVGYSKPFESTNLCKSMSTIERSVLKGFFADRGVEISFNTNKVTKGNGESSERWRAVLENVKKKYYSSPNLLRKHSLESSCAKMNQGIPNTLQAPKRDFLQSTPINTIKTHFPILSKEQYCQTSIIGKEDQLVQCNISTTSNSVAENQSVTSQSSFLYVAPEFESTANNSCQTSSTNESNTAKTFVDQKLHGSIHNYIEDKNFKKGVEIKTREIDLGISLLCSLIESKNFNNHQKKKLAQKIVLKITKHHDIPIRKLESSSKEVSSNASGMESLSSPSNSDIKITSRKASVDVATQTIESRPSTCNIINTEIEQFLNESPAPNTKFVAQKLNCNTEKYLAQKKSSKPHVKPLKNIKEFTKKNDSQLFETMKEWLEPLTNSELEYDRKLKNEFKENINRHKSKSSEISEKNSKLIENKNDIQKKIHLNWIDTEIRRLENLKNILKIESSEQQHSIIYSKRKKNERSKKITEYDKVFESIRLTKKPPDTKKDAKTQVYDDSNLNSRFDENKIEKILENISNTISDSQMTRSKLKTPTKVHNDDDSSDSIRTFAKHRKQEFIENYKIAHSSRRSYDHPMLSDHYSEPGYKNIPIANKDFIFSSKYRNTIESSSNDFISSQSISIPVGNSDNSSTSTTHQYDTTAIKAIGIQTSDSILQTTPIFGVIGNKLNNERNNQTKKTARVYGLNGKSEQIQVKPQTISYTIKVDDSKNTEIKYNENLSLRDHLQTQCPEFCARALKRQAVLKEMQRLRKKREEQIRNIAENTSLNSINRKLDHIPPPPTKCVRVFSTKEMKALTRKKQKCLSEVVNKVDKQKKEKQRRGTKILTDVFNKRLQRQVHNGKLSLEHSITVI